MGLMGTLAKVAIGYAAARGVDQFAGGQGLGKLLGGGAQVSAKDPNAKAQAQMAQSLSGGDAAKMPEMPGMAGLAGMMGGGGGAGNPMQDMMAKLSQGGLGGMMGEGSPLGDMMKKMQSGAGGFDMSQIFGSGSGTGEKSGLLSQLGAGGTGLAGLLAMAGGAAATSQGQAAGKMIDAFQTQDSSPEAEEAAALMIRAMIQAAKSDGGIDASEKAKILETLGDDADPADIAFVQAQLKAPVDAEALAKDTPEAQRLQVYSASLMTIRVDTDAEAQYLHSLARGMELQEPVVNALHIQMGLQPLYA